MKTKYLACMAAAGLLACTSLVANAETKAVGGADGIIRYYSGEGVAYSYNPEGMTDEELQRWEAADREQKRESLAYLEKYGVTYDADKDHILYQGKTVRWLLDEQFDGIYATYFTKGGEIDLYTERDENSKLTGVREATKEEYDKQTKLDEENEKNLSSYAGNETAYAYDSSVLAEDAGSVDVEGYVGESAAETTVDYGTRVFTEKEKLENEKRSKEYEAAGIGKNEHGSWTWKGDPIYMLMDDDGSMYQNGSEQTRKNKIYVYVSRDENGNIIEAEKVEPKDLLQHKADSQD